MTARPGPPLGAHVRGFPAWLVVLELERSLPARLDSLVGQGVAPALVEQARAAWADLQEAARAWQEWRAAADGSAAVDAAAVPADSDHGEWSTEQVAAVLGMKERRVRQLLADGRLTGRLVGGRWLVSVVSAKALCEARRAA